MSYKQEFIEIIEKLGGKLLYQRSYEFNQLKTLGYGLEVFFSDLTDSPRVSLYTHTVDNKIADYTIDVSVDKPERFENTFNMIVNQYVKLFGAKDD